jgi:hypothetical protein
MKLYVMNFYEKHVSGSDFKSVANQLTCKMKIYSSFYPIYLRTLVNVKRYNIQNIAHDLREVAKHLQWHALEGLAMIMCRSGVLVFSTEHKRMVRRVRIISVQQNKILDLALLPQLT